MIVGVSQSDHAARLHSVVDDGRVMNRRQIRLPKVPLLAMPRA